MPEGSDFPVQSLLFGVFQHGGEAQVGVAIGNQIVAMAVLEEAGIFAGIDLPSGQRKPP